MTKSKVCSLRSRSTVLPRLIISALSYVYKSHPLLLITIITSLSCFYLFVHKRPYSPGYSNRNLGKKPERGIHKNKALPKIKSPQTSSYVHLDLLSKPSSSSVQTQRPYTLLSYRKAPFSISFPVLNSLSSVSTLLIPAPCISVGRVGEIPGLSDLRHASSMKYPGGA